jgi:choline dehydrogenase
VVSLIQLYQALEIDESGSTSVYVYVLVGAATAGCVVAARLSEDPDARVLLLEAAGATPPALSADPPAWHTLLQTSANWGGTTTTQAATGTTPLIGRGRGLGGSSAINGMVFARGQHDSYASWPNGSTNWSFDDPLPYFKKSETTVHGDPALRGTNLGNVRVGVAARQIDPGALAARRQCSTARRRSLCPVWRDEMSN